MAPHHGYSPIVVAPKPKQPNEVRICVDMRQANKAVVRERHPAPTLDNIQTRLNGASVLSKLDLRAGYHQLELAEECRSITTFSTHVGLRRYKRLNFGISCASEIFQNVIENVIDGIEGAMNISDDVIVFGSGPDAQEKHAKALEAVCERLAQNGFTANLAKCEFSKRKMTFYGMVFSAQGMELDPQKVEAILRMDTPSSIEEIQSFLGMTNYCSRFIPNYSTITAPLRELTHKDHKFEWGDKEQSAFEALQKTLASQPLIAYFDIHKPTEIAVDASPVGLGAILVQHDEDGKPRVAAYGSRSLTPTEQRYAQVEREALAVVWACEHFHLYFFGSPVTIVSDHKPLVSLYGNPRARLSARMER